jgi:hypothetical protein
MTNKKENRKPRQLVYKGIIRMQCSGKSKISILPH